jgi:hypothetical protein
MWKEVGMKRKYEELYNNETENLKRRMVEVERTVIREHIRERHQQ